ncbi:hypothetical protein ACJ73_10055 [Blastomyces percursus]|uniref:Uncharacterized protein n=1 Tax=Blastomyces percursus TaxID=1658174 RepID=A0A1J9Q1K4_9EURO|nr:hypothetical protein ACJ73_10055 [Blastomyces percursus]
MHLWVGGRRFLNVPMLLADLGSYEMILGRVWLAEKEVWLDVKNRRLVWPEERSPAEEIANKSQVMIPRNILKRPASNSEHQKDADRWDRSFEQEIAQEESPQSRKGVVVPPKARSHRL